MATTRTPLDAACVYRTFLPRSLASTGLVECDKRQQQQQYRRGATCSMQRATHRHTLKYHRSIAHRHTAAAAATKTHTLSAAYIFAYDIYYAKNKPRFKSRRNKANLPVCRRFLHSELHNEGEAGKKTNVMTTLTQAAFTPAFRFCTVCSVSVSPLCHRKWVTYARSPGSPQAPWSPWSPCSPWSLGRDKAGLPVIKPAMMMASLPNGLHVCSSSACAGCRLLGGIW